MRSDRTYSAAEFVKSNLRFKISHGISDGGLAEMRKKLDVDAAG